jgi:glycosyltransferase involved in cell wall biosynthesis
MSTAPVQPQISIVTPVRNGERFLGEAIGSVLAQSLPDFEYLIVDGASTDGSRDIAAGYAARDPRVRVLSEPDRGMYDAILKGLALTGAPLCCWLNADDRLMPGAFELLARYVRISGAAWVTGLPACMDGRGLLHTVDTARWYPRPLLRAGLFHDRALGFVQQEGTVFARHLLDGLDAATVERIRGSRQAGDSFLWRAFAQHAGLHVLPTVLGVFRQHEGNMSAQMATYHRELAGAGYPIPPRLVAGAMKAAFVPAALLRHKLWLRRWRALWPALLAGELDAPAAGGKVEVERDGERAWMAGSDRW